MLNVVNGGAHARNSIDFQEFMVMPVGAASFAEALRWGAETYHALRAVLAERGLSTAVGDEGGFAPDLPSNEEAVQGAGGGDRARRAGSPATRSPSPSTRRPASCGRTAGTCWRARAARSRRPSWSTTGSTSRDRYPIVSIEDGMAEDDWDGWAALTAALGDRVQLVGDDLFVTNVELHRAGHRTPGWPTPC